MCRRLATCLYLASDFLMDLPRHPRVCTSSELLQTFGCLWGDYGSVVLDIYVCEIGKSYTCHTNGEAQKPFAVLSSFHQYLLITQTNSLISHPSSLIIRCLGPPGEGRHAPTWTLDGNESRKRLQDINCIWNIERCKFEESVIQRKFTMDGLARRIFKN